MYEFSLWKNPTALMTAFKVLLVGLFVPTTLMFFLTLGNGIGEALKVVIFILGYGVILMIILLIIGYVILASIYGGNIMYYLKWMKKE